MARKVRIGRPPRTDDPTPITLLLPGALKRWLHEQAVKEGRPMGHVLEDAIRLYQAKVAARAKRAERRDRGKA